MWWKTSGIVTFGLTFVGSFSFWRVAEASWQTSAFGARGVACAALGVHRIVALLLDGQRVEF